MQALVLSRNKAANRAMEVAQHDRVTELEQANTELKVELELAQIKMAEMEVHQNSLCSG
jgi:hypothetical protein